MITISNLARIAGAAALCASCAALTACGSSGSQKSVSFRRANLVSDQAGYSDAAGTASSTDAHLKNPWGIAFSPSGFFWIADNGTGDATLYDSSGATQALVVHLPGAGGGPAAPTGQVYNGSADFEVTPGNPGRFVYSTEDGVIVAWASGTDGVVMADSSALGAVYKGLAMASNAAGNHLYAADFHNGAIDVFDRTYAKVTLAGTFTDPALPAGFAPFNVASIGGSLYVSYARQDAAKHDDTPGVGSGLIDVFDVDGHLVRRLVSGSLAGGGVAQLNSPWGMAIAPSTFGRFAGDLLVGNFGDGHISVFDPRSGAYQGQLQDSGGAALAVPGLWALAVGNGGSGGQAGTLYFTAGINGEQDGLFGSIQASAM